MTINLLRNGDFEEDWGTESSHHCHVFPVGSTPYETDVGNIFTPAGWTTWYRHQPGEWDQPEVRDAWVTGDPARVHSGQKAMLLFTFHRKHWGGFYQQVQVAPGTRLYLRAVAHAWSNHNDPDRPETFPHPDDPRWSEGAGVGYNNFYELEGTVQDDGAGNFTFAIGIDPTGGTDPFADTVVWGDGAHIYNAHAEVPPVETTAQSSTVTVFLESKTLWPFKHNDAYWDDVELVAVDAPPEPPQPPPDSDGWDYRCINRGSKLGIHGINQNQIISFCQQAIDAGAPFPVVKAVDDLGWLVPVKQVSPATITIGRLTGPNEGCQDVGEPWANLNQMAYNLIQPILQRLTQDPQLYDVVDYWEIANEPDPPGVGGYAALSQLMIRCMDLAEQHNLSLALFSLNMGTPEWDEMVAMAQSGVFGRAYLGGHVLALHEGPQDPGQPIDLWWGDSIPGAPNVPGAGACHFRYRYLYEAVRRAGEPIIPLVISEWYGGLHLPTNVPSFDEILSRVEWWDDRAREDYWVWGCCPFTLGPVGQWVAADWDRYYPTLIQYMIGTRSDSNAQPPVDVVPPPDGCDCRGKPREPYKRIVFVMPQSATIEMYQAATYAVFPSRSTTGFSPDDAGVGDLDDKTAVVVNPSAWGGGLQEFFDMYYPGTKYEPIEASNPFQLQGRIAAVVTRLRGVSLEYPTTHKPAFETSEFGVWRETYYHNGCDLRSSAALWNDRILAALPGEVVVAGVNPNEPWFGVQVRTRLQVGDMTAYVRYAHFVDEQLPVSVGDLVSVGDFIGRPDNTGQSTGDHLHIDVKLEIGDGDWWSYADPRLLFQTWPDSTPVVLPLLVGIHDEAGGEWMRQQGMTGVCLCHGNVTDAPAQIDMRHLSDNGIRILYRLNHGYGGGAGTLPPQNQMMAWVDVVATTILNSHGVWGWIIGNEMNNPTEWPNGQPITPQYYAQCYNEIWERVSGFARLTPGAIDPYNAELMDPMQYMLYVYQTIHGLDFIALHGKTQGSEPSQCWSDAVFTDQPLVGRFYHLRTLEDQLSWIPERFLDVQVYVTELNPQRKFDGSNGWQGGAVGAEWTREARAYCASLNRIAGVCYYRFEADDWAIGQDAQILDAIKNL